MNNPVIFFYAKVLQYFNYAGIKIINVHAQTSFIFSATLFFYFLEIIKLSGMESNIFVKIAILLVGPTLHLITYSYFNNEKRDNELTKLIQSETPKNRILSNALTFALVVPMVVFFTITVFAV